MAYFKKHFLILPELEIGYTFSGKDNAPYRDIKGSLFKVSVAVNPYSIKPKVGLSILNVWDIYVGYGFEFRENDYTSFDGIVLGSKFQIPL